MNKYIHLFIIFDKEESKVDSYIKEFFVKEEEEFYIKKSTKMKDLY